jgi:serine/threonine protein kinase
MQKKKIDNYTIFLDKKLGEGSFGAVYLGEQDKTNIKVAVKMLSKKTSKNSFIQSIKMITLKRLFIQKSRS